MSFAAVVELERAYEHALAQVVVPETSPVHLLHILALARRGWIATPASAAAPSDRGASPVEEEPKPKPEQRRRRQTAASAAASAAAPLRLDANLCQYVHETTGRQCPRPRTHVTKCKKHFRRPVHRPPPCRREMVWKEVQRTCVTPPRPEVAARIDACLRLGGGGAAGGAGGGSGHARVQELLDVYAFSASEAARDRALARIRKGLMRPDEACKYLVSLLEERRVAAVPSG
jgi:hypothetical protein